MTKVKEKLESIKLREVGMSIGEISENLKVSKSSISSWVRHLPATPEMKKRFALKYRYSEKRKKEHSKILKRHYNDNPKPKTTSSEHRKIWKRSYAKKYYAKRRKWAINYLGGKCRRCNTTKKLEFDHIDHKDKSYSIAVILSYNKEKIIKELNKCQLLCKSCHRKKTYSEGSYLKRKNIGENAGMSKLKNVDIPIIRERISNGEILISIAKDFNVSRATISMIKHNRIWNHIK